MDDSDGRGLLLASERGGVVVGPCCINLREDVGVRDGCCVPVRRENAVCASVMIVSCDVFVFCVVGVCAPLLIDSMIVN